MNWTDITVIAIILIFALKGLKAGFIMSVFRLVSFFASAVLSVRFYPLLSAELLKTSLFTSIKSSILKNLLLQQKAQAPALDAQARQAASAAIVDSLKLPGFMKEFIAQKLPNPSTLVDMNQLMDALSGNLAKIAIDILALLLLFIAIWIVLNLLKFILAGIAKLPVFRQLDGLGGLAFGALEGLLAIYVILAFLMILSIVTRFNGIYQAIDSSLLAKFFYQSNFIINWMFPG